MALTYSIVAAVEETPLFSEVCSFLEKEPNYSVKKMPLELAGTAIGTEPVSVMLVFEEHLSNPTKKWVKQTIEKKNIPAVLITRDDITAQDLGVSPKMMRSCCITSTDIAAANGIARNISIKIKLVAKNPDGSTALDNVKRIAEMAAAVVAEKTSDTFGTTGKSKEISYWDGKQIIAVGASMGGVETVTAILKKLPKEMPPIVVTQHMPEGFTDTYAMSLNLACAMRVVHAEDRMPIEAGTVYIAPGGKQMKVKKGNGGYVIVVDDTDRVDGHKPSVTALFQSVAKACGKNALGVILTGMGSDGARGLLEMRKAGAKTLGQDEASCVVYGMPRAAFEMGAVQEQVSMNDMHLKMIAFAKK